MRRQTYLIDVGPGAGSVFGGDRCRGNPKQVARNSNPLPANILSGKRKIPVPTERSEMVVLLKHGASENNLQDITAFSFGQFSSHWSSAE